MTMPFVGQIVLYLTAPDDTPQAAIVTAVDADDEHVHLAVFPPSGTVIGRFGIAFAEDADDHPDDGQPYAYPVPDEPDHISPPSTGSGERFSAPQKPTVEPAKTKAPAPTKSRRTTRR